MTNLLVPLQQAILPVVLISPNILFLSTLTNRYTLISARNQNKNYEGVLLNKSLLKLRNAIILDVISILFLLLMIMIIFICTEFHCIYNKYITILFIMSNVFIILSLILYLLDVFYTTNQLVLF